MAKKERKKLEKVPLVIWDQDAGSSNLPTRTKRDKQALKGLFVSFYLTNNVIIAVLEWISKEIHSFLCKNPVVIHLRTI